MKHTNKRRRRSNITTNNIQQTRSVHHRTTSIIIHSTSKTSGNRTILPLLLLFLTSIISSQHNNPFFMTSLAAAARGSSSLSSSSYHRVTTTNIMAGSEIRHRGEKKMTSTSSSSGSSSSSGTNKGSKSGKGGLSGITSIGRGGGGANANAHATKPTTSIGSSSSSSITAPTTTSSTSTSTTTNSFTSSSSPILPLRQKVRNALFPIHGKEEVTKFLLIGSIKFFVILALTLTRDNKDTMVVTECGAEAIAFLKIYGVLPAATLFIALYSKMATIFEKKSLFYVTCIPFFVFFFLFDAVIYPNRDAIQPSLSTMQSILGVNHESNNSGASVIFAKLFTNWTSALFYIIAEVYSSVSVGILFWQYANDVVSISQAKRFYPLFAQMSGLAPIVAGQYVVRYASRAKDFGESLHRLTWMVTFSGVMICLFYKWSNEYIEKLAAKNEAAGGGGGERAGSSSSSSSQVQKKKKKTKMSMVDSARFLASSEYLRLIAALVLGYGLSINFTDIIFKSIVKRQYPDPLDYQRFMGNFSSVVGLSTCIVIFLGVHAIRILGWRMGALATPAVMACLAFPYFSSILVGGLDSPASLRIAVIFGTIQTLLSKTTKYALFDPTTQMAYIPLDDESKVKGKAAIEVLGSRIGKSGGSLIQQGLVLLFGNIINAAPVLVVLYYSVLAWWAFSANRLGSLFLAKTAMQEQKEKKEHKI